MRIYILKYKHIEFKVEMDVENSEISLGFIKHWINTNYIHFVVTGEQLVEINYQLIL